MGIDFFARAIAVNAVKNQHKTITENGVYRADEGYTGLGTVTVNVPQTGGGPTGGDDSIKWLFKDEIFQGLRTDLPAFDPTTYDAYVFINGGDYVYKLIGTDLGIGYTSDSVSNDSPFIIFIVAAVEGVAPANSWYGGNVYGDDPETFSVFLVEKQ